MWLRFGLLGALACACANPDLKDRDQGDDAGADGAAVAPDLGPQSSDPIDWEGGPDTDPQAPCTKMDILFVIDNSGSMEEEQLNLALNFPQFIEVLDGFDAGGGPLDYRVAVTTTGRDVSYTISGGIPLTITELGEDGELLMGNGCGLTQRWVEHDEPDVAGKFSCVAAVGTSGPGIEMPLYALDLALVDRVEDGTNAGFLREDAVLAIVIITDENDCSREDNNFTVGFAEDPCAPDSLEPVEDYRAMLDEVTGARGRWAMAVIAGASNCTSAFGDAAFAERLASFVVGTNTENEQLGLDWTAVFSSICVGDLTVGLQDALETFQAACEDFGTIK